jgi:hypothetical protein
MLNPDIFCRPAKKTGEQREQGEQPHEYRRISVHPAKNEGGTEGTDRENVPPVPFVPPENMPEIKKHRITTQGEISAMFTCAKIRNGSTYVVTSYKSQGHTRKEVIIAAENLDSKSAYVACLRGKEKAYIFTPDKENLFKNLGIPRVCLLSRFCRICERFFARREAAAQA